MERVHRKEVAVRKGELEEPIKFPQLKMSEDLKKGYY